MMEMKEAFAIVVDLAQENVLTEQDAMQDPEILMSVHHDQSKAVKMVIDFLEEVKEWEKKHMDKMDRVDAWHKRSYERQECVQDVLRLTFDWSGYSNSKLISLGVAIIQYLQLEEYDGGEWDFLLRAVVPRLNDFCRTKEEKEWMLSDLAIKILQLALTEKQSSLLYQEIVSPEKVFEPGHEKDLEE